jgi:hypothetical protein
MKTKKTFSILVLAAIIFALAFAACPQDADGGGGNNNNNVDPGTGNSTDNSPGAITGGKDGTTITTPVTGVPDEVTSTDFSYFNKGTEHINTYIPDSSVTVSGGNVTIKLGVPNSLDTFSFLISNNVTVNPSDAKAGPDIGVFYTSNGSHKLLIKNVGKSRMGLIYVDKDVIITGARLDNGVTINFNLNLKAGWNYVIIQRSGMTETYTSSTSLPTGLSWQVVAVDELDGTSWISSSPSDGLYFGTPYFEFYNYVSGSSKGEGTYTISGNTVTLTFDDGTTKTGTLSGNTLTIDSVTYTKQQ